MNLKKIIALTLVVCMVLSFFPVSVFAEEWDEEIVLTDEEYYEEPQEEYVEEIIEEEPADYVEYVEPAEEIVVEDELPVEEPVVEEPAEEPDALVEEPVEEPVAPAAPVEEAAAPAAMTANLESAETFGAARNFDVFAPGAGTSFDSEPSLELAIAAVTASGSRIEQIVDTYPTEGTADITINSEHSITIDGMSKAYNGNVTIASEVTIQNLTIGGNVTFAAGAKATLTNVTITGTVTANGGDAVITTSGANSVTLSGGNVTLDRVDITNKLPSVNVQSGTLTIAENPELGDPVLYGQITAASGVTGNVKGGQYYNASAIPESLIADGYMMNDQFVIVYSNAAAKIDKTYYDTFEEAATAAGKTGEKEIKLYKDVDKNDYTLNEDTKLKINLNNHKFDPTLPYSSSYLDVKDGVYSAKRYAVVTNTGEGGAETYAKTFGESVALVYGVADKYVRVLSADLAEDDIATLTGTNTDNAFVVKPNGHTITANVNVVSGEEGYTVVCTSNNMTGLDEKLTFKLAPVVAYIGEVPYATLADAVAAAEDGKNTIVLAANIALTAGVDIDKKVTIDLAGYTIKDAGDLWDGTSDYLLAVRHGGDLTISDSGETGAVTMTKNWCAIKMTKADDTSTDLAKLTVSGGTITGPAYAISGNGNPGRGNTAVVIDGGVVVATADDGTGIYQPQEGTVEIKSGSVTGVGSGIAIKSGTLTVSGGTVTCTGPDSTPTTSYSNGVNASGAAIQIESNKDYTGNTNGVTVTITGGKVESANGVALYEYVGSATAATSLANGGLTVSGSNTIINSGADKTPIMLSEEASVIDDVAVSGGTFNNPVPENYCADGYIPTKNGDTYGVKEGVYVVRVAPLATPTDLVVTGQGYEASEYADAVAAAKAAAAENKVLVVLKTIDDPTTGVPAAQRTINLAASESINVYNESTVDAPVVPTLAEGTWNSADPKQENGVEFYTATLYAGNRYVNGTPTPVEKFIDLVWWAQHGADYIEPTSPVPPDFTRELAENEVINVLQSSAYHFTAANFTTSIENTYIKQGTANVGTEAEPIMVDTYTVAQKRYVVDGKDFYDTLEGALAAIKTDGKFTNAHNIEALDTATVKAIKLENLADVLVAKSFTVSTDLDATISQSTDDEGFTTYSLTAAVATLTSPNGKWNYTSFAGAARYGTVAAGDPKTTYVTALVADTTPYPLATNTDLTVYGETNLYSIVAKDGEPYYADFELNENGSRTWSVKKHVASVTVDATPFYGSFNDAAQIAWTNRNAEGVTPVVTLYADPLADDDFTIPATDAEHHLYETGTLLVDLADGYTWTDDVKERIVKFPPAPENPVDGSSTENVGRYFGKIIPADTSASGAMYVVTEAETSLTDKGSYYYYFLSTDAANAIDQAKDFITAQSGIFADGTVPTIVKNGVTYTLSQEVPTVKVNENGTDFKAVANVETSYAYRDDSDATWKLSQYVAKIFKYTYNVTQNHDGTKTYTLSGNPVDVSDPATGYKSIAAAKTAYDEFVEQASGRTFYAIRLIADPGTEKYKLDLGEIVIYDNTGVAPTFDDPDASHKQNISDFSVALIDDEFKAGDHDIEGTTLKAVTTESAVNINFTVDEEAPIDARFYADGKWYGNSDQSYITDDTYPVKGAPQSAYAVPDIPNNVVTAMASIGYEFDGWYVGEEKVEQLPTVIPEADTDYVAKWTPIKYTLAYNGSALVSNGTSLIAGPTVPVSESMNYTVKNLPIDIANINVDGYTFIGWQIAIEGTESPVQWRVTEDKPSLSFTSEYLGNVTLTPVYAYILYTIDYDLDGGTLENSQETPKPVNRWIVDDQYVGNPTKADYDFAGWSVKIGDAEPVIWNWTADTMYHIEPNTFGNMVFTARWTTTGYNITYNTTGKDSFEQGADIADVTVPETPKSYNVLTPEADRTIDNASKTGYGFDGWIITAGQTTETWTPSESQSKFVIPAATNTDLTFTPVLHIHNYIVDGGAQYFDTFDEAIAAIKTDGKFTADHKIEALAGAPTKAIVLENMDDVLVAKGFTVTTTLEATINQTTDSEGFTTYSLTSAVATLTSPNGKWSYNTFAGAAKYGLVAVDGGTSTYVTPLQADLNAFAFSVDDINKQLTVTGGYDLFGTQYTIDPPEGYDLAHVENKNAEEQVVSTTYTVTHKVASVTYTDAGATKTEYGTFKEIAGIAWANRDAKGVSPVVTLYAEPDFEGATPDVFSIPLAQEGTNLYQTGTLVVESEIQDFAAFEDTLVTFPPRPIDEALGSRTVNEGRYFHNTIDTNGGAKYVVTEAEAFTRDNGQYYHYFQTVAEAWSDVNNQEHASWYPARYAPVLVKVVDVELTSLDATFTVNTNNLDMTDHVTVNIPGATGKYAASKPSENYEFATEWSVSDNVAKLYTVTYDYTVLNTGALSFTNGTPQPADTISAGSGYETLDDAITAYRALQLGEKQYAYIELIASTSDQYKLEIGEQVNFIANNYVGDNFFVDPDEVTKVTAPVDYAMPEFDSVRGDVITNKITNLKAVTTESAVNISFTVDPDAPVNARFYANGWYGNGEQTYITDDTYSVKGAAQSAYTVPDIPANVVTEMTNIGYEFDGWYVGEEKVEQLPTVIPDADTDYVAKWTPIEYTLAYNGSALVSNGGQLIAGPTVAIPESMNYTVEGLPIGIANINVDGYTFIGWQLHIIKPDGTEADVEWRVSEDVPSLSFTSEYLGNATLTPVYTYVLYTIDYELDGGTLDNTPETPKPVNRWIVDDQYVGNPTKDKVSFAGWSVKIGDADPVIWNVTADAKYHIEPGTFGNMVFTAIWTQKYDLNLYIKGQEEAHKTYSVAYGDLMPALTDDDYAEYVPENHVFSKWVIEQSPELGNIEYTRDQFAALTMPAQDVDLVAYTDPIKYKITVTVPDGAAVTADGYVVDPAIATKYVKEFTADELPVTLPVADEVPFDGHAFTGWFADGSETAVTQITTAGNYTLTGRFTTNVYPVAFYDRFNGNDTLLLATNAEYGTSIYELGEDLTATHTTSYYYPESKWMDANNVVIDEHATVSGTASFYLNWKPLLSVIYKDPTGAVIYKTVSGLTTKDLLLTDAPELTPPQAGMVLYWTKIDGSYAKATELIVEPTELKSAWVSEEDIVTVTFNPANGDPAEEVPVIIGQKVDRPEDPVRTEFLTFDAWYADGETSAFDFDAPITEDVNLTAAWILDDTKVTANFGRTPALQENINLNAKLGLSDATIASGVTSDMFYVEYIVDGETHRAEPFVPDNYNVIVGGKVFTTKTAEFFSYQMWKPIIIKFFFDDGGTDPVLVKQYGTEDKPYSLKEYFDKQWDTTQDPTLKTLVKSVLDYGASAQIYFNGRYETNVENLVNSHVNPDNIVEADKPTNVAEKIGKIDGTVERVGATVRLDGDIKMSVKIQTEQMDKLTFSVPIGYAYEIDEEEEVVNNIHTVLVKGIKSNMLGNDILFTISGKNAEGVDSQIKYTYSPFTYAAKNWDSGNNLAGLCHAMVEYGNAARAYFG